MGKLGLNFEGNCKVTVWAEALMSVDRPLPASGSKLTARS